MNDLAGALLLSTTAGLATGLGYLRRDFEPGKVWGHT